MEKREQLIGDLVREVRQLNGIGASFFRAVAGQVGMNAADVQVLDILDTAGPTTAGRLAELAALTTGAITQMVDRLEKAGLVRREKDPDDGRRVVVRLVPGAGVMGGIGPVFASAGMAWEEMAASYNDEQLAFLLEFVKRAGSVSREEIDRLREAPAAGGDGKENFSVSRGDLRSGRLIFSSGAFRLVLRAGAAMDDLYRARFRGLIPKVKTEEGTITVHYPRRLRIFDRSQQEAEILLSAAIPWRIDLWGGASEVIAELGGLDITGLEVRGGASSFRVELPKPSGTIPVRIAGGASEIIVRRPEGVPARVHLKGWASHFTFDDQIFSGVGNDVRLQSPGYENAAGRYDVEVSSSVSNITVTTSG